MTTRKHRDEPALLPDGGRRSHAGTRVNEVPPEVEKWTVGSDKEDGFHPDPFIWQQKTFEYYLNMYT